MSAYTSDEQALIERYEMLRGLYERRIESARAMYPGNPNAIMGDEYGDELEQTLVEMERILPESYVYPGDEAFLEG